MGKEQTFGEGDVSTGGVITEDQARNDAFRVHWSEKQRQEGVNPFLEVAVEKEDMDLVTKRRKRFLFLPDATYKEGQSLGLVEVGERQIPTGRVCVVSIIHIERLAHVPGWVAVSLYDPKEFNIF